MPLVDGLSVFIIDMRTFTIVGGTTRKQPVYVVNALHYLKGHLLFRLGMGDVYGIYAKYVDGAEDPIPIDDEEFPMNSYELPVPIYSPADFLNDRWIVLTENI